MGRYWDARAKEDALYFVDSTQAYGAPEEARFWREGERTLTEVLAVVGQELSPADRVVEVGCGVGRLTRPLARRVAHVAAIDVSPEMLRIARERHPDLANVEWLPGDGSTLEPVADASATGVFSHVVFQHLPSPSYTYGYVTEMGRVLRPGGWAVFHVSDDPEPHRLAADGGHAGPRRRDVARGRAPKGQDDPSWRGSAIDLSTLHSVALEAGLMIERIEGSGTRWCFVRAVREEDVP